MNLISDKLAEGFAAAFAPVYEDGVLYKHDVENATGDEFVLLSEHPVKVQEQKWTAQERAKDNIPDRDVRLFVLRGSLKKGVEITSDDEIMVKIGGCPRYRVSGKSNKQDVLKTYWDLRCSPDGR